MVAKDESGLVCAKFMQPVISATHKFIDMLLERFQSPASRQTDDIKYFLRKPDQPIFFEIVIL